MVLVSFQVERVRVGPLRTVPVRGRQRDDDLRAFGDLDAGNDDRLGRVAESRMGDGCVIAKQLFYGTWNLTRIVSQSVELRRMTQQSDRAVAEQARRGVVSGNDELEDGREQLLFGET